MPEAMLEGPSQVDARHDVPAAMPSVFLATYGCQMNVLDSELVRDQLTVLGYILTSELGTAEVVLLNTCSIRALSEQKVWSFLGRLGLTAAARPERVVGVLGCMAEREGNNILQRMPHVDLVCGPSQLHRLSGLIDRARRARRAHASDMAWARGAGGSGSHAGALPLLPRRRLQGAATGHAIGRRRGGAAVAPYDVDDDGVEALDRSRAASGVAVTSRGRQAYVRITRGCNKFCAFCVVPTTRGPEVHRPPQNIVDEVRRLVQSGVREVTLLGQTVNHYTFSPVGQATSFAQLLQRVHDEVPELWRLRFITSYPRDFGDDALDVMARCPRICPYLHIPLQSGSNGVLRRMNRGYTVEGYLDLLARARQRMPHIRLAGDMIVGFCGETDADHAKSLEVLAQARYKSCYIFKYSPRSGTVAHRRLTDDVPEAVKKTRNREMLALQNSISLAHHRALIGQAVEVLVEGFNPLKPAASAAASSSLVQLGRPRPPAATARKQDAEKDVRLIGRTVGDELVALSGPPHWVGERCWVRGVAATPLTLLGEAIS